MRTVNVLGKSHKNLKVFCAQSALQTTSGFLSITDSGIRRSCHMDTVHVREMAQTVIHGPILEEKPKEKTGE